MYFDLNQLKSIKIMKDPTKIRKYLSKLSDDKFKELLSKSKKVSLSSHLLNTTNINESDYYILLDNDDKCIRYLLIKDIYSI